MRPFSFAIMTHAVPESTWFTHTCRYIHADKYEYRYSCSNYAGETETLDIVSYLVLSYHDMSYHII